jgi:tRNA nucleotidyltransferase (CCA-adding enzyme)
MQVIEEVLSRIVPSPEEEAKLREVEKELIAKIDAEASRHDRRLYARLLGSASRGTWLRHQKDLDVFVFFPEEYSKQEMERIITGIAERVLKRVEKRYAEHPYVRGEFHGYDVELVPCYAIPEPKYLKSAVDRTPFHNDYVRKRIPGRENEVRLLKQFLKGIGCYGAEAKVEGFSGYLCELLVIKFGSFLRVLQAAKGWRRGEVLSLRGDVDVNAARRKFSSPLIFLDPVDENRNVAAALSVQKFSEFVHASKEFLAEPKLEFFFPRERRVSGEEIEELLRRRGTHLLALSFPTPEVVDDILYPQLRKARRFFEALLREGDFDVVGSAFHVGERSYLFFELSSAEIPVVRLHLGPKVSSLHEPRFLRKYALAKDVLSRPFILGDRWAVYLRRKHTRAEELLGDFIAGGRLRERGVPSHIARALEAGGEVLSGDACLAEEALLSLLEYLDPRFPWER